MRIQRRGAENAEEARRKLQENKKRGRIRASLLRAESAENTEERRPSFARMHKAEPYATGGNDRLVGSLRNTPRMGLFSPAQVVGYLALALGITAFLQKSDQRLKFFNASQGLFYALHFVLLGNLPASASSLLSSLRSFLALRYRSWLLGAAIIGVNVGLGAAFAKNAAGWLPVIGSCIATMAIFTMKGVPFRCVLLTSTLLWLANNIISGSIGGTLLEVANAIINIWTMIRMVRYPSEARTELSYR